MLKRIEYNPAAAGREKRTEVHFFFFFFSVFLSIAQKSFGVWLFVKV